MRKLINLQRYDGGNGGGEGGSAGGTNGGTGGAGGNGATYSYEQAEEIANARAARAEQAALKSYFQQQGMTQEQINQAISDFKEKQNANKPDITKIQQQLDAANKKNAEYENEKILTAKGVKQEDLDYVAFKVAKMVTDKKDFKTAAEEFLKENPRFTGQTYRMSTGSSAGNANTTGDSPNEVMNNLIRNAFRR